MRSHAGKSCSVRDECGVLPAHDQIAGSLLKVREAMHLTQLHASRDPTLSIA